MANVWISFALYVAAAGLAVAIARSQRAHAPVAAFLLWLAIANPVILAAAEYLGGTPEPVLAKMAFRGEWFLRLSVPLLFAATTAWVCRVPMVAYASLGALLALTISIQNLQVLTPEFLLWLTQAVLWSELALVWPVLVATVFRRGREQPTIGHLILIIIAANDVAALVVPLARLDAALGGWNSVVVAEQFGFAVVVVAQAWWLFRRARA